MDMKAAYPLYSRFGYGFLAGVIVVAGSCIWLGSGFKGCHGGNVLDDLAEVPRLFYYFWPVLVPFCSIFGAVTAIFTPFVERKKWDLWIAIAALVLECVILCALGRASGCIDARF